MNVDNNPISLAHVHAYIDAQLNDEDCVRLEDYFDANPEKFEQLQQYLAINDHYQSVYDPVLKEEIPQVIVDRLYSTENDPFQSEVKGFHQLTHYLTSVIHQTPDSDGGIKQRLYYLLRLDRLKINTSYFDTQTLPVWLVRLRSRISTMIDYMVSSYRGVNLYAAISIAAIGIMIGMSMGGGAQVDSPVAAKRIADVDYAQLQAVQGHTFYRGEGQSALETDEERQHQLLTWLSDRYGKEIRIVDFSKLGYSNAGMTLVPSANNFSLLTIYENTQGQYLTLYIGLRGAENSGDFGCTSGARVSEDANSVCAWASDKLQFVVVSDLLLDETKQLAEWMKQNYSMAHLISSNEYFFSQTFGTTSA